MLRWCVLLATCFMMVFLVVEAEESDDEKYAKWKKHLCENRNRTFNNEMNECFQTEPEIVKEASADCVNRILPSANGNLVDLLEVACVEKSAYLKFMACNEEYMLKEEYRAQMEVSAETIACYDGVLQKYGLKESEASN